MSTEHALTVAQLLLLAPEQRRYEEHLLLAQRHSDEAAGAANAMVRMMALALGCRPEQVDLSRLHEGTVRVTEDGIVAEVPQGT